MGVGEHKTSKQTINYLKILVVILCDFFNRKWYVLIFGFLTFNLWDEIFDILN